MKCVLAIHSKGSTNPPVLEGDKVFLKVDITTAGLHTGWYTKRPWFKQALSTHWYILYGLNSRVCWSFLDFHFCHKGKLKAQILLVSNFKNHPKLSFKRLKYVFRQMRACLTVQTEGLFRFYNLGNFPASSVSWHTDFSSHTLCIALLLPRSL